MAISLAITPCSNSELSKCKTGPKKSDYNTLQSAVQTTAWPETGRELVNRPTGGSVTLKGTPWTNSLQAEGS